MEQKFDCLGNLVDEKLIWPLEERDSRWEKIRLGMALRGLDCLLIYGREGGHYAGALANFSYMTNLFSGGFCIFTLEEEPVAFCGTQNKFLPYNYYSCAQNWIKDVRSQDTGIPGAGLTGVIEVLKGLGKKRIGFVDGNEKASTSIPYRLFERIIADLPEVHFSDETSLLVEARMIKSNWEIEQLRKAGKLANLMFRTMIEEARQGVTEARVVSRMLTAHIGAGGDPHTFIDLVSSPITDEAHLLHGKNPPYSARQRTLQNGDLIMVEFHAPLGGYLAAAEISVVIGEIEPEYQHIHDVAVKALLNGTEHLRAGIPFNVAVEAFRSPVIKAGMAWLELGVHQHGLSSGGFPTAVYPPDRIKYIPLRTLNGEFAKSSSFKLQEGMVFGQNIDIHNPSWRKNVGVKLGDTVVITKNGPERICDTPLKIPVVV